MQHKEHIVIGLAPEQVDKHRADGQGNTVPTAPTPQPPGSVSKAALHATLVTRGHLFAALTIIPSLCIHLHLVMLEHVLTNVEHDRQWQIFVRICAFWLNLTEG
jgi:hypothetical protein